MTERPPSAAPDAAAELRAAGRDRLKGHAGETEEERRERKLENRRRRVARRKRREPFLRFAVWAIGSLPVGVAAWLGEFAGSLGYHFATFARARVLNHLRYAYEGEKSEPEITAIARSNFRLMGRALFALPAFVRRGPAYLRERISVPDDHLMREVIEGGKGVIALTHHFGLFDGAGMWLARDWNGVAVGRDGADMGPTRLMINMREKLGVETIERGDARAIVRALRDATPVGMLADHDVEDLNGVFVPFYGKLAHTPLGPATLAIRTKVPIIPTVMVWTSRTTMELRILGVCYARDDLPRDRAAHELTARFTRLGEEAIRANPDHWIWIHKRWQTRPEARPELPVWDPAVEDAARD